MACLTKEKGNIYRIHWKFQVRVGSRTGETVEGSLQLGRCTRAAARGRLRGIETWEEAVKTGRHLPDTSWDEVFATWVRERELTYTPQSLARAKRVVSLYRRWREARDLPCKTVEQVANRQDLTTWRNHRLDHEAGRKTVANDFATLSALFGWCAREKYLPDNPIDRITRPRFVTKKEGTPLTRQQAGRWLRSIQPLPGRGARGSLTWKDVRRKRQIGVLLLNTGVRNGEFCTLDIDDLRVDDESQMIHVLGKGLKRRWVPLNRAALAAIRLHLRERGNPTHGPLFVTQTGARYNVRQFSSELVQTARRCSETVLVNPHNLRHTLRWSTFSSSRSRCTRQYCRSSTSIDSYAVQKSCSRMPSKASPKKRCSTGLPRQRSIR